MLFQGENEYTSCLDSDSETSQAQQNCPSENPTAGPSPSTTTTTMPTTECTNPVPSTHSNFCTGPISQMHYNLTTENLIRSKPDLEGKSKESKNPVKRLSRKRKRDPDSWKKNERKELRQSGKLYVNRKGNIVPERIIKNKKDCLNHCRFKCAKHISEEEQIILFKTFWSLTDEEKTYFYAENTLQVPKLRTRTKALISKKENTIYYFFYVKDVKIRVCKVFFLNTLCISQRRVDYFYKNILQKDTGLPRPLLQGKGTSNKIPEDQKERVRGHIREIPVVEPHYCRPTTSQLFFETHWTISKLYESYVEYCKYHGEVPVKKHLYNNIFDTEFNISFLKPKNERCDRCELVKLREREDKSKRGNL